MVWEVRKNRLLADARYAEVRIRGLAFDNTPQGNDPLAKILGADFRLFLACSLPRKLLPPRGEVRVLMKGLRPETGWDRGPLLRFDSSVSSVEIGPGGSLLTCGIAGGIQIFNIPGFTENGIVQDGELLTTLPVPSAKDLPDWPQHVGPASRLNKDRAFQFSADGRTLFTRANGELRTWDISGLLSGVPWPIPGVDPNSLLPATPILPAVNDLVAGLLPAAGDEQSRPRFGNAMVSSDGRWVACSRSQGPFSNGWELMVLEVATRREVMRTNLRDVVGFSWAFSPNGQTLALAVTHTGNPTLLRPSAGTTVELSRDIYRCYTMSLFDVATGQRRAQWATPGATGVAFTRDGRFLVGGNRAWYVDTRNAAMLFPVALVKNNRYDVALPIAFSGDGRSLITFPDETEMVKVEVASGKVLERKRRHFIRDSEERLQLSPEGSAVLLTSVDELYDTAAGTTRPLITKQEQKQLIRRNPLLFSPDGKRLLIFEEDHRKNKRSLEIWEVATLRRLQVLEWDNRDLASPKARNLTWSADGATIAWLNGEEEMVIWHLPTGKRRTDRWPRVSRNPPSYPTDFKFSPDGRTLFVLYRANANITARNAPPVDKDPQIHLLTSWDVATLEFRTATLCVPAAEAMACLPDGRTLALLGQRAVYFWDLHESRELARLPLPAPYPRASAFQEEDFSTRFTQGHLAVTPDGKKIAAVFGRLPFGVGRRWEIGPDGSRSLWTDHARVAVWDVPAFLRSPIVTALAVSPDGKWVAAGRSDHTIHVFETKGWKPGSAGKPAQILRGHRQIVRDLSFSPDSRLIASAAGAGNRPGEATLWDFVSGKELLTLPGHPDEVTAVAFRPDGLELATDGMRGHVLLWDLGAWKTSGMPPVSGKPKPEDYHEESSLPVVGLSYGPEGLLIRQCSVVGKRERPDLVTNTPQFQAGTRWGNKDVPLVQDVHLWGQWPDRDMRQGILESLGHPVGTWHKLGEEFERNHTPVRLAADHRFAAWGTDRGTVIVFAAADGPNGGKRDVRTKLPEIDAHTGPVRAVAFAPDNRWLVSGGEDGMVKLWTMPTNAVSKSAPWPSFHPISSPDTSTQKCCHIVEQEEGVANDQQEAALIRIQLPPAEVDHLEAVFQATDERKLRNRLQIILMAHRGRPRQDIATDLGIHRRSVTRWLNAYCDGGLDALRPRKAKATRPRFLPP